MSVEEFEAKRESAGRRYAAAVAELKEAWAELSALDHLLANRNFGHDAHLRSFVGDMHGLPSVLCHPVYAPSAGGRWSDRAADRLAHYLGGLT